MFTVMGVCDRCMYINKISYAHFFYSTLFVHRRELDSWHFGIVRDIVIRRIVVKMLNAIKEFIELT